LTHLTYLTFSLASHDFVIRFQNWYEVAQGFSPASSREASALRLLCDALMYALRVTFDRLLTLLAFLAIALAAFLMPAQNDTWWHLKAGERIWTTRHVLLSDTFSFTASGAFWPNHEWLSQVIFYGLYALGGLPLLTVVCASAVVGAWAIAWQLAPASPRVKFLLVAWVLGAATTAWTVRPQALSLLLVAVTVWLLVRRRYIWLPPLFVVWANLHGAVLTGLVLVAAACAASLVEKRGREGFFLGSPQENPPRPLFRRLALTAVSCALATLATPLGYHLWLEIPAFFVRIRQVHVDEFSAPQLVAPLWIPFWTAAATVVVLAAARGRRMIQDADSWRRGDVTLCACALALLAMAVTAARNVGPFLLVAVPTLAALMPAPKRSFLMPRVEHVMVNCAAALASIAIVAGTVVWSYARRADRLQWDPLPAASVQALESCSGNVYNRFDEGGYLIWFAPRRPVFIDSRYLPYTDDFIKAHVRIEQSGNADEAFRRYDIRCAYVPAGSLVGSRLRDAGWKTLYQDARWSVLSD